VGAKSPLPIPLYSLFGRHFQYLKMPNVMRKHHEKKSVRRGLAACFLANHPQNHRDCFPPGSTLGQAHSRLQCLKKPQLIQLVRRRRGRFLGKRWHSGKDHAQRQTRGSQFQKRFSQRKHTPCVYYTAYGKNARRGKFLFTILLL
jgi:hypothetical protein